MFKRTGTSRIVIHVRLTKLPRSNSSNEIAYLEQMTVAALHTTLVAAVGLDEIEVVTALRLEEGAIYARA
jgi:hypothetical protein